ncbi:hypothetical protein VTK73DRAFT_8930 [Phialemonium thermophilum]|uniref:NTF2-like protein n=1 Tax=Phialemonium thermophilum TaxID=223376 RepID=A0ABR3W5N9_9PEZI
MSLQTAYKQFLAAPQSSSLSEDASLHYITTTTSFHGATDIIKHVNSLRNQVTKKKEEFLHVVEGQNAISAEIETTLEFVRSGGVYLPGLDDNFLVDRTVYLPITHVVTFDSQGKIAQIRQSWDQGALLKQLEVIGRTGRNWPIRESQEQIKLITSSVKLTAGAVPARSTETEGMTRSRGNSTNALRDPHASLCLFAPREELEQAPETVISPYAGRRPRQRSFTEILGDEPAEEEEESGSPSSGRARSQSPSKAIAPKVGAGKHFQPIRLFEADENVESPPDTPQQTKTERRIRPDPSKYQHFEFADGSDPQDAPKPGVPLEKAPKSKHDSQWSFEDFVTPQKAVPIRARAQDVRHWGTGTENEEMAESSPAKKQQPVKPRRDAETHFEFQDDGEPSGEPRLIGRPRGAGQNTGLGLYKNNVYDEEGAVPTPGPDPRALGNITNLKDRRKDFDAHFNFTDASPQQGNAPSQPKAGEDRKKVVKMMESNWSAYDESPVSQKENSAPGRSGSKTEGEGGIAIAGDGMGGKKGSGRGWAIGDESDEERNAQPVPGKKLGAAQQASSIWDF